MAIQYYLQFTNASGQVVSLDGGSLYAISEADYAALQTLNIGSQSGGAGAGKATFDPLNFTLGSSNLTALLDQMMANGASFSHVDLYGFDTTGGMVSPTPVVHDMFKLAAVKSDTVDPTTGAHQFAMEYGGLVESVTPRNPNGSFGTLVVNGWNAVFNKADSSLTTDIDGGTIANPTATSSQAAPTAPTDQTLDTFMQIRDASGNLLGGGSGGWIELSAADLSAVQTLNIGSQSGGAGAGKITFDPASLTFAPGTLAPTLLKTLASGATLEIEIATYTPGATGHLVDDYRFGTAALASASGGTDASQTYTLDYGQEKVQHYVTDPTTGATVAGAVQGWDITKNSSIAGSDPASLHAQQAPIAFDSSLTQSQNPGGPGGATRYYLQFTNASGQVVSLDGGSLYAISEADYTALQTLNIGSQSGGAGAGKATFDPLNFTLGSSNLTALLDQMMASGASFSHVDLYGFDTTGGMVSPTPVVHDMFKLAAVKSDTVDPTTGAHQFAMDYGGLVESVTPRNQNGNFGTPVVNGWNARLNKADSSLTTDITGASIANPTATSSQAATTAPTDQTLDTFMQIRDASGNLLGGGSGGWIELSAADLSAVQTLNIGSQSGGAGAGKITFDPASLTFAPGTLAPTLLKTLASGAALEIEIATYTPGATGHLVDDYRFGTAALASASGGTDASQTYTLDYGQEKVQHYVTDPTTGATVAGAVQGWDITKNSSIAGSDPSSLHAEQAPIAFDSSLTQPQNLDGPSDATQYYLQFTTTSNQVLSPDGGSLYAISEADYSALQTLNIASNTGGAGAGKATFDPLNFTLGSSNLTALLDQMMASGTPLSHVDLYGFNSTNGVVSSTPIVHDEFKVAGVKSDTVDVTTGAHQFALQYGGVVESVTPRNSDGSLGTPVVNGWDSVRNDVDTSQTTTLSQAAPTAPTDQTLDTFTQIRDANGNLLGGGSGGWIELSAADLSAVQTLNIGSQSGGAGAGKITFDPASLTFAPGTLAPALLKTLASGAALEIEIATYTPGATGHLVDDYRFGTAALASASGGTDASQTYTLDYGQEKVQHYVTDPTTGATVAGAVQGWDITKNSSIAGSDPSSLHAQQAPIAFDSSLTQPQMACYVEGTLIRTEMGDRPIESLKVGDSVVTASGELRPIVWLGRRRLDLARHPDPKTVWPIRVSAGAFGPDQPSRDLWLSPRHAIFTDGVLMPIDKLINGRSIVQIERPSVTYWHVELESHDILLAEGLASETYLDRGNRTAFENGGAFLELHPTFEPTDARDGCAPFKDFGPEVAAVKALLIDRVVMLDALSAQDGDGTCGARKRALTPR